MNLYYKEYLVDFSILYDTKMINLQICKIYESNFLFDVYPLYNTDKSFQ